MPSPPAGSVLTDVWAQQRVWSHTASRLKSSLDRARAVGLLLAVSTAVLAAAATQVTGSAGRALTAAAAVTAGVATVLQRQVGTDRIRAWTRARSAAEGLKHEVYAALAGGSEYAAGNRDDVLAANAAKITEQVGDLWRHTLGVQRDDKPLPPVSDVDSYLLHRVDDEIATYYEPKAAEYEKRVRRLRRLGEVLGVTTVVVAALASAFEMDGVSLWVPVLTTVGASLAAYISAARYDHLIIEFLRTARRLGELRQEYLQGRSTDPARFVDDCEAAISVENQAWMARWNRPEDA